MTFTETQRVTQWWIWTIIIVALVGTNSVFAYGVYEQIILGHPFGNHPSSDSGLIVIFVLTFLITLFGLLLVISIRLRTIIDERSISFRFFPFQFGFQKISWDEIESFEVVTYNPVKEYGGWGIRFGKNARAFNMKGNKGLMIHLKTGKNILLGTQKETELKSFLDLYKDRPK